MKGPCFRRRSRVDFRPWGLAPPRSVHASGRHAGLFRREPEDHFASGLCSTRFALKPSSARDGRRDQTPAGRLHWLGGQSPGPRRTSSPQGQSAFRPARGSSPSLPPKLSRSTDPRRRFGVWIRDASPCGGDLCRIREATEGGGLRGEDSFSSPVLNSAHPGEGRGPDRTARRGLRGRKGRLDKRRRHFICAPAFAGVSGRKNAGQPPDSRFEPGTSGVAFGGLSR
jgi:hypothetical protein